MHIEHVITGASRSGLAYVRDILQRCRVASGITFQVPDPDRHAAQLCQYAYRTELGHTLVPLLSRPELAGARVTYLLRDPLRVYNSLMFLGRFAADYSDPMFYRYVARQLPAIAHEFAGCPGQATCHYILEWYAMARRLAGDRLQVVQVEQPPGDLLAALGYPRRWASLIEVDPRANASGCRQQHGHQDLPTRFRQRLRGLARQHGYVHPVWQPRGGHAHWCSSEWHR